VVHGKGCLAKSMKLLERATRMSRQGPRRLGLGQAPSRRGHHAVADPAGPHQQPGPADRRHRPALLRRCARLCYRVGPGYRRHNSAQRLHSLWRALTVPEDLAAAGADPPFVQRIWSAQWRIPSGEHRVQPILPYPSANDILGVVTHAAIQRLEGVGSAFGAKLQPGALRAFGVERPF
jgi:hypothetical protein